MGNYLSTDPIGVRDFQRIQMFGYGGTNNFTNDTAINCLLVGGPGPDTLKGGSGENVMFGGSEPAPTR